MNTAGALKSWYRYYFLWIPIAPIVVLITYNIVFSFSPDLDFLMTLVGIFLSLGWLIFLIISGILMIVKGKKMQALSCVMGIVGLACVWPTAFILANWFPIGDYVHLAVVYPIYKMKIDSSPAHALLEWNWGTYGFVSTFGADRKLFYDPSDKLPQKNKIKDSEWQRRFHDSRYFRSITTKHLIGHFYLVEEIVG